MIFPAIDPGHGHAGSPTGVVQGSFVERDFVLDLARDIVRFTPAAFLPWLLLRTEEQGASYDARARHAKAAGAQIVFCLHANAAPDPETDGMITFYWLDDPVSAEAAHAVTRCAPVGLLRRRKGAFPVAPTNWTKRAYNVMAPYREAGIPAVLVEVGHVTNTGDLEHMLNPAFRPGICCAILAGLCRASELLRRSC